MQGKHIQAQILQQRNKNVVSPPQLDTAAFEVFYKIYAGIGLWTDRVNMTILLQITINIYAKQFEWRHWLYLNIIKFKQINFFMIKST